MNNKIERVLNVKSLKKYVLKRKLRILISFILGIVIGCTYLFIKTPDTQVITDSRIADLENAKQNLNNDEINEVNTTYTKYKNLEKEYKNMSSSNACMKLDPDTSKAESLIYYINAGNKTDIVASGFLTTTINRELCDEILKRDKEWSSAQEISSLMQISDGNSSNSNIISQGSKSEDAAEIYKNLVIKIFAKNSSELKIMESAVKKRIHNLYGNFKKSYGNFSMNYVGSTNILVTQSELDDMKVSYSTRINTVYSALNTLTNSLTTNQKTYFDALAAADGVKNTSTKVKVKISPTALIKNGLLVGVIICLLDLILIVLHYFSNKKLHSPLEVTDLFNVKLITTVNNSSDYNRAALELNYYLNENKKRVGVTSTVESKNVREFIDSLDYQDLIMIPTVPRTEKDFSNLKTLDEIIFVEENEVSDVYEIKNLIDYYLSKDKEVNGMIVID